MDDREAFVRYREIAIYWYNKSSDLRGSAAALWVSREDEMSRRVVQECGLGSSFHLGAAVPSVFRMLAGMSLELVYKATLAALSSKIPHTHELERLATLAGVVVDAEDVALLEILTGAIVWDGRYPVPKTAEAYETHRNLEYDRLFDKEPLGGRFVVSTPNGALNWAGFDRLWGSGSTKFWERYEPR